MTVSPERLGYVSRALRWLPPGMPGKARLARRMLGSSLETQDAIIHGRDGIQYTAPSLREPVGFYLLIDGVYECQAVDFVLRRLQPGAVFVDVGANIGVYALPAAQVVGPEGRVVAVEPSPRVFPYLERNVMLNHFCNVRLVQRAAYNSDGATVPFYEAPVNHFGMGSLAAQFHAEPVPVPCRTLDHILEDQGIERADVLKVDVEGFEAAVFEGAKKLLTGAHPPLILFEFCDWAETRAPGRRAGGAQRLLRDWDYEIWRLGDLLRNGPSLSEVITTGFEMLVAIGRES